MPAYLKPGALILMILALAACFTSVLLRHPVTGQTVRCGPYLYSGTHSIAAAERERGCVEDFQRQRYERVP